MQDRLRIELADGAVEYVDTGGSGPVLVLLHGVLMDSEQWREVVPRLRSRYRCVLPTLPLGGHRLPMPASADLSLTGHARRIAELLEALDLEEVTLVFNDWAAPQILVAEDLCERVQGMVLAACETAGNYPPGLPGKNLTLTTRAPGGLRLSLAAMRWPWVRRLPVSFGWMAKHGMPDDLVRTWVEGPWRDRAILADARRYFAGTGESRQRLQAADAELHRFRGPVSVVWAKEDKVMPLAEGRALADAFPNSRFQLIDDTYVLIPLDQPAAMASAIDEHMAWTESGAA